jgi:hypothetical protein
MQFQSDFFTRDQSSKMFQTAKMLMFDERLSLYNYPIPVEGTKQSLLIEELFSLQAQQVSRNLVIVEAPKIAGAHDDQSDALIRAIWLTHERMSNQKYAANGRVNVGDVRPYTSVPASTAAYQMARMRSHGIATERNPRAARGARMLGRMR